MKLIFQQKTFILLLIGLFAFQISNAIDVVDVKPTPPNKAAIQESEKEKDDKKLKLFKKAKKKTKKGLFRRAKERFINNKLSKLLGIDPAEILTDSTNCDVLIKQDGEEVEVKVLEVNPGVIIYKKCDYEDGPSYSILKEDVFLIKYKNGRKEVFNENGSSGSSHSRSTSDKRAWGIGFALGFLVGLLGLLLAAVIFDDKATRKKAVGGALVGILTLVLLYLALLAVVLGI